MRPLVLSFLAVLIVGIATSYAPPAFAGDKKGAKAAAKKKDKPADKPPEGARVDARANAPEVPTGRGASRIEFDDRLIQGQTNKANAIYLFERRESALRSLLKKRTDFHAEIDETLE